MSTLAGRRVAILTASDSIARGDHQDASGDIAAQMVGSHGGSVAIRDVLPDDQEAISARLRYYADDAVMDLVLTTGGSGLGARDVTPEATLAVLERVTPGLPEAARQRTLPSTPLAMLSRGVAGVRRRTLIVNLPGSPKAVSEWLEVLLPVLPHALEVLAGDPRPWGAPHRL